MLYLCTLTCSEHISDRCQCGCDSVGNTSSCRVNNMRECVLPATQATQAKKGQLVDTSICFEFTAY